MLTATKSSSNNQKQKLKYGENAFKDELSEVASLHWYNSAAYA